MCTPKSVAISKRWTKFQNLKVGQCDLYYVTFWYTFLLHIFRSLQSIRMISLNSVALERFTAVRKFKSRSPKLGHVPFDLVFCLPSKLLVVDAHTKFEISRFSCSKDIWDRMLKIWASFAILDSILGECWLFFVFQGATEYPLVKFERNLSQGLLRNAMVDASCTQIKPRGKLGGAGFGRQLYDSTPHYITNKRITNNKLLSSESP